MMTFSIKDAVKNIREQHNLDVISRLKQTVSSIFEVLESALKDGAWTRHVEDDRDYCQTRYGLIMDNKGNVVLENINICLHEDKIRIIATILPQFSDNMTPINVTDLTEIIKIKAERYDFPITLTIYSNNRYVCDFEYIPDQLHSGN